ncbi:hypothetical protein G3R49_17285 [Shewanella sp. WXL01]|uniref:Uncharacterized protein n=1 Tax=Shewanella maritima TaxID=2520507 RepID=A0A411PI57_9GAMM|nr:MULTISPECIES: hypothetical protein [Shewanella]NKF52315.1 hypothetical protein [Shewanella sp. WXL01]QBF83301.1 hypothetical protein EXU30_11765 [Shewanella maritima]
MFNKAAKQVWYGELRTSKGNTVVVYDGGLPEASPGRLNFFHSGRNAIIEFVEDIVTPNLHDLDAEQTKAAKAEFGDAWETARNEFLAKHPSRLDLSAVPDSAPATKTKSKDEEMVEEEVVEYIENDDDDDDEDTKDFDEMGDNLDDMD